MAGKFSNQNFKNAKNSGNSNSQRKPDTFAYLKKSKAAADHITVDQIEAATERLSKGVTEPTYVLYGKYASKKDGLDSLFMDSGVYFDPSSARFAGVRNLSSIPEINTFEVRQSYQAKKDFDIAGTKIKAGRYLFPNTEKKLMNDELLDLYKRDGIISETRNSNVLPYVVKDVTKTNVEFEKPARPDVAKEIGLSKKDISTLVEKITNEIDIKYQNSETMDMAGIKADVAKDLAKALAISRLSRDLNHPIPYKLTSTPKDIKEFVDAQTPIQSKNNPKMEYQVFKIQAVKVEQTANMAYPVIKEVLGQEKVDKMADLNRAYANQLKDAVKVKEITQSEAKMMVMTNTVDDQKEKFAKGGFNVTDLQKGSVYTVSDFAGDNTVAILKSKSNPKDVAIMPLYNPETGKRVEGNDFIKKGAEVLFNSKGNVVNTGIKNGGRK